jgi:hypothetical protein
MPGGREGSDLLAALQAATDRRLMIGQPHACA